MKPGKGGEKEKEKEQESLNEDVSENPKLYKSPLLPRWIRMICTRREIMASFFRSEVTKFLSSRKTEKRRRIQEHFSEEQIRERQLSVRTSETLQCRNRDVSYS